MMTNLPTKEIKLSSKPDFDRVMEMWKYFWAGDVLKRPLLQAQIPRKGCEPVNPGALKYHRAVHRDYAAQMELIDRWLESMLFLGETVPFFAPDHGPDQFAAFFGGELKFSKDSLQTSWIEPFVEDWEKVLPLRLDENNSTWRNMLEYSGILKKHAAGRYVVGMCDLHSNADALSAMRNPEKLCMDFYDCPELIEKAMQDVRQAYQPVYNALFKAGGMEETGSTGWINFWCAGKFAVVQCDFVCMASPEIAKKYIFPALEEEANFLDHCIYHLDGPQALRHLDGILGIEKIDAIQWVPGDGQRPQAEWVDVFKKCQRAGKGLKIYANGEMVKKLSRELSPEGVAYAVGGIQSEKEFDDLAHWLEQNT